MDKRIKWALIIGGTILGLILFWKAILALGIIVSIVCWLFSGSGDGSAAAGGGYNQQQQPSPTGQSWFDYNASIASQQVYNAQQGIPNNGRGAIGTATTNTYPVGSMWQESARLHPYTGKQMGTDVHYGGRYEGTYSNRGVYTYDPDGRTIYGD